MFVTTLVIALLLDYSIPVSVIVAVVATILESITPLGLDNLTVPIMTALIGVISC